MKRSAVIVCVVLVLNLLGGCLKDEVGGIRVATDSTVEVYSVTRQVGFFLFYAGGPWTVTCDQPWLQVVKPSGPAGSDTLAVITTEKNLTGSERLAHLTIESEGHSETVTVRQTGEFAIFDITPKDLTIPAEGGPLEVPFKTNVIDSLQLYVSVSFSERLVDTRQEDSTQTRAVTEGTLKWLRVIPNTTDKTIEGYLLLAINNNILGGRVDLDTLHVIQPPMTEPDSLATADDEQ